MPLITHERRAIEALLHRINTQPPVWMFARVAERLALQSKEYTRTQGCIRFIGVSRPHLAINTRENQVGIFIQWTPDSPPSPPTWEPFTLDREWSQAVLIRDPSPEEQAACPFGGSVIRVAEAIDIISILGDGGDLFRSLGLIEYFVVC